MAKMTKCHTTGVIDDRDVFVTLTTPLGLCREDLDVILASLEKLPVIEHDGVRFVESHPVGGTNYYVDVIAIEGNKWRIQVTPRRCCANCRLSRLDCGKRLCDEDDESVNDSSVCPNWEGIPTFSHQRS